MSSIFKTTNVTNLTKLHQIENTKQPVYFLKAVEFCSTFDIQIDITLAIFWGKLQDQTFQKTHRSLSKHANIHINRATHYEITALQKYEKFAFLLAAPFLKKILTFGILMNQIFGKGLSYLRNLGIGVLLKLQAVEVAN